MALKIDAKSEESMFLRDDIHTQVATLNFNMTLESEPSPSLTSSMATNIPSFRRKTKKSCFLIKLQ